MWSSSDIKEIYISGNKAVDGDVWSWQHWYTFLDFGFWSEVSGHWNFSFSCMIDCVKLSSIPEAPRQGLKPLVHYIYINKVFSVNNIKSNDDIPKGLIPNGMPMAWSSISHNLSYKRMKNFNVQTLRNKNKNTAPHLCTSVFRIRYYSLLLYFQKYKFPSH